MFERRFGIRAFDYWYGYTIAQIELMVMDSPVVDYNAGKKRGSMMATRSEVAALDELQAAWEAKRNGRTHVGKEISLNEFVNGG